MKTNKVYTTGDLDELSVIATALWQLKTGGIANATELAIADRLYEEVHTVIDEIEK